MKHQCKYKCASKYSETIDFILEWFEILCPLDSVMFKKLTWTHIPHRVLQNTTEIKNVRYFEASTATVELFSPLRLSPKLLWLLDASSSRSWLRRWRKVTTKAQCWSHGVWRLRSRFYWSELKFFYVFVPARLSSWRVLWLLVRPGWVIKKASGGFSSLRVLTNTLLLMGHLRRSHSRLIYHKNSWHHSSEFLFVPSLALRPGGWSVNSGSDGDCSSHSFSICSSALTALLITPLCSSRDVCWRSDPFPDGEMWKTVKAKTVVKTVILLLVFTSLMLC